MIELSVERATGNGPAIGDSSPGTRTACGRRRVAKHVQSRRSSSRAGLCSRTDPFQPSLVRQRGFAMMRAENVRRLWRTRWPPRLRMVWSGRIARIGRSAAPPRPALSRRVRNALPVHVVSPRPAAAFGNVQVNKRNLVVPRLVKRYAGGSFQNVYFGMMS